tara:strand:+ start:42781 stop:43698 length:918 start_codon:yes stop_codon:yes gene_type:complete
MLQSIALFSMQGRWQAAGVIALFSVAALMLPPFSYLASGVIVLCTLRMGPKEGIKVVVATTALFGLLAGLLLDKIFIAGLFLISSWLPIFGISWVLGYTRSLAMSLLAATGLGIVVVFGTHIVLPDPVLWWQQLIQPLAETLAQQPGWQFDQAQTQAIILNLSGMMTGLMAAGLSLNIILGLLIGRSWQAKLYNPGGFASEFQQLRLGKSLAILTIVMMIVTALPLGDSVTILRSCLPVLLVVFTLQGLSVVHAVVKQQQRQSFWLVAVYVLLLVMMPQMAVLLTIIGVLEQWFNFRRLSIGSDE